jgi:LPS export ABC transporter protein LptC
LFLAFLAIWLLWPRELDGFTPGRDGRLAVPDYAMTNARYVSVKEGRVEMESLAQESAYDLAERRMDSKKVTTYFYNGGEQKTEVTADQAQFFMDQRRIHLLGNVTSTSPDGFVMRGPEAEYRMDERRLSAPQPVEGELPAKNLKIWGERAESAIDERTVELIGDARAQYMEPKRGLTKIRGDRALMERDKQQLTFRKNVKVEQDKMTATSNVAHVFYASEIKNVRYMSLLEDVKISEKGGRYTRSQVAEFFAPTDTIVLSQFPSVYHGDDVVTGDRITLYRTTGVVEVTATNAAGNAERLEKKAPPRPLTKEDEELIP